MKNIRKSQIIGGITLVSLGITAGVCLIPVKLPFEKATKDVTESAVQQVAVQAPVIVEPIEREATISFCNGDTIASVLSGLGISKEHAHKVVDSLKPSFDPRAFKKGQEVLIRYRRATDNAPASILSMSFQTQNGNEISLTSEGNSFKTKKIEIKLTRDLVCIEGTLNNSFYAAALKKGVPSNIVKSAIDAFSHTVNWQHDPKAGDKFALMYEVFRNPEGKVVRTGSLQYAAFAPGGKVHQIYHYQPTSGTAGYFNAKGESLVKCLLQTPLEAKHMNRVTSKFGNRHHPMLGYTKHHKGVDFGAPTGTKVMSAGEGVVVKACWYGAYGNYVLIKHNNEYSTAYAHLSKINVRVGQRVSQRAEIGRVGTTGRSTGPHLHFEVLKGGHQVNPQGIKQMPSAKLVGKELGRFMEVKATIQKKADAIPEIAMLQSSGSMNG